MDVKIFIVLALLPAASPLRDKEYHEKTLNNKHDPYDRRIRPFAGEKQLEVEIYLRVLSLRSVSELTMDYKIELYFREYWQDPRLAYDPSIYKNDSVITLHESVADELWTPDTYFPNAIKSKNPDSKSTTHRSLVRVASDGHVLYSRRLSITAECPMDLSTYPFDNQVCGLSIESYGHEINEVKYTWRKENPVNLDSRLELPEFKLVKVETVERNITLLTGTYTRLECCFFFKRSAGFYFIQLFLPATAIVVTSWLLLCMETTSKFSDMIEVILAITLLYYSYITVMPRVSYVKAMDIYLGSCFLFVFISLIKLYALKLNRRRLLSEENFDQDDGEEEYDDISQKASCKRCSCDGRHATAPLAKLESFNEDGAVKGNENCKSKDLKKMREDKSGLHRKSEKSTSSADCIGLRRNVCHRIFNFFAASLAIYPSAFVLFSIGYFLYFLLLVSDGSERKCIFSDL